MSTGTGRNSQIKYKSFDSLWSDVRADFSNYALENLLDPASAIRAVRRCNADLGIRINQTHETILDLNKGCVRLPDHFHSVNFAFIIGEHFETVIPSQGTHIEERPAIPQYRSTPANIDTCATPIVCSNCHLVPCGCGTVVLDAPLSSCSCGCSPCSCGENKCASAIFNPEEPYGDFYKKPRVYLNCKGECMELVQHVAAERRHYKQLIPLKFRSSSEGIDSNCLGLYMRGDDEAWVKDGFLFTNSHHHRGDSHNRGCEKVYLNFEGEMETPDGTLLVPDHPLLIYYYEAAIKVKICENLLMNGEDVAQKLQYWKAEYAMEKGSANAVVNMPNFEEIKETNNFNRRAMYNRYFSMYSSGGWFDVNMANWALQGSLY